MALRWNELEDDLPPTPASSSLFNSPRTSGRRAAAWSSLQSRRPGSDSWDVSCTDETDYTQDDGEVSDCPLPQSLFSRQAAVSTARAEAGVETRVRCPHSLIDTVPQKRAALRRGAESRHRAVSADEEASCRRQQDGPINADGHDDLVEGVWGLSWGRKRMWASALESPWGKRLRAFGQRGNIFAARNKDLPRGAQSPGAGHTFGVRSGSLAAETYDHDADADGDVSESESRRVSTPCEPRPEVRLRSRRSMSDRVRHVAVRAKELAATMGQRLQRRRRYTKSRPPVRSPMILLPGGIIRRTWDCIGLFLLLVLILVQVANERWKSQHEGWMFYDIDPPYKAAMLKLQVLQDVFFIVDIFVNFRTAYCDEKTGEYVKDAWRIAAHYSRHWLVCDLFCAIPLDLILDDTPATAMEAHRKKGKNWLKRLVRRTGALHVLRQAAGTRPFNGARRVGKLMVHGRRMMRALGGLSQTVRGVQTLRQVLSIKSILAGWAFLRQMGVLGIFSQASVAARTLAGSFAFLRLVVSSCIRGWEEGLNAIRALALSAASLLRGGGDGSSAAVCAPGAAAAGGGDGKAGTSKRGAEKKYQARGRNPLAPSLSWLMRSAGGGGGDKAGVEAGAASARLPAHAPACVSPGQYEDGHGGALAQQPSGEGEKHETTEHSGHETEERAETNRDFDDGCDDDGEANCLAPCVPKLAAAHPEVGLPSRELRHETKRADSDESAWLSDAPLLPPSVGKQELSISASHPSAARVLVC